MTLSQEVEGHGGKGVLWEDMGERCAGKALAQRQTKDMV